MKKILFSFILLLPLALLAQNKAKLTSKEKKAQRNEKIKRLIAQEEEGALIFYKQSAFGLKLNTDGFSMSLEKGKYKTLTTTNHWWVEIGERKDPKQIRITGAAIQIGYGAIVNTFSYGKMNNFFYLKGGVGKQKMIGSKASKNGITVSALYGAGISIGMLKPYYLETYNERNLLTDIKYSTSSDSVFLNPNYITGASGIFKGLNEITYVPGLNARAALRFDYGHYNDVLSAIQIGVNAEYYTQKMPIMLHGIDRQLFIQAYIAIEFGKRK